MVRDLPCVKAIPLPIHREHSLLNANTNAVFDEQIAHFGQDLDSCNWWADSFLPLWKGKRPSVLSSLHHHLLIGSLHLGSIDLLHRPSLFQFVSLLFQMANSMLHISECANILSFPLHIRSKLASLCTCLMGDTLVFRHIILRFDAILS